MTDAYLAQCDLTDKLKEKLTGYWNYPKIGIPNKRGNHYYFQYNSGLQNQHVMYRIAAENTYKVNQENPTEGTEVFIDPNTLSTDGTASLHNKSWSEDGRYMAY